MHIFNKQQAQTAKQAIIDWIKEGKVFIYPTDTIYGIGCDATNEEAVKRIRDIKQSYEQAFSIIPPSKQWIAENCTINEEGVNKLPGPYTLILKIKENAVANSLTQERKTIGIRIPHHWCTELLQEANTPIVTTSVNIHGHPFLTDINSLTEEMKNKVDFIIDEGQKTGKPSTIIDLTEKTPKITER